MKRFEVPLTNMPNIIATYIVLHSFYIVKGLKINGLLKHKINQLEKLAKEKYKRAMNYMKKELDLLK